MESNVLVAELTWKRARSRKELKMLDWVMGKLRAKDGKQISKIAS